MRVWNQQCLSTFKFLFILLFLNKQRLAFEEIVGAYILNAFDVHVDVKLMRIILVVFDRKPVVHQEKEVWPLTVEIIQLLPWHYGSIAVVVEGYKCVWFHAFLDFLCAFEPIEILKFVRVIFLCLLIWIDLILYLFLFFIVILLWWWAWIRVFNFWKAFNLFFEVDQFPQSNRIGFTKRLFLSLWVITVLWLIVFTKISFIELKIPNIRSITDSLIPTFYWSLLLLHLKLLSIEFQPLHFDLMSLLLFFVKNMLVVILKLFFTVISIYFLRNLNVFSLNKIF